MLMLDLFSGVLIFGQAGKESATEMMTATTAGAVGAPVAGMVLVVADRQEVEQPEVGRDVFDGPLQGRYFGLEYQARGSNGECCV